MSLLKLAFNLLLIYGLWQLIKVAFTVNTARKEFRRGFEQMQQMHQQQQKSATHHTGKQQGKAHSKLDSEGEYIDFEEVK